MPRRWFALLGMLVVVCFGASARAQEQSFSNWSENFKARAAAEGISTRVIDEAFSDLAPDEEVIRLDRKQPENKISLTKYVKLSLSQRRIEKARAMMQEHREILEKVSKEYGVQPEYIVALWAVESDFGNNKGNFSVVQSLATLAYEGRRAEFFGNELIAALKIIDAENMPASELSGSWAGAMGDCQFMPSTYLRFAVDADRDGHRDIWGNPADVFASIANYLHSLGWDPHQGWGRPVIAPKDFKASEADIRHGKTASYWRKRGLEYGGHGFGRSAAGKIPKTNTTLYALYPGSHAEGVYLVTNNYKALLQWNRSRYFATAVGALADAIGE